MADQEQSKSRTFDEIDAQDEIVIVRSTLGFLCCATESKEDLGLHTILSDLHNRAALIEGALTGRGAA
jgi:hypothetical protein